jgi:hypothetical protein
MTARNVEQDRETQSLKEPRDQGLDERPYFEDHKKHHETQNAKESRDANA